MSDKKIAGAAEKAGAKTKTARKRETVMYIGPNITGVVTKNTLLADGKLPAPLQKKTEEIPVLQSLLIPVSELAKTNVEIKNPCSAVSICYKKAEEMLSVKEKGGVTDGSN